MQFNMKDAPSEGRAEFPKFSLQKDESARINFLSTAGLEVAVRHWVDGMGYVHCHAAEGAESITDLLKLQNDGGNPEKCIMCRMFDDGNGRVSAPQRRFAARILRYKTDTDGKPLNPLSYWMEIWVFDNQKYRNLQDILDEWGGEEKASIRDHDLQVTCSDPQYQKFTIQPTKSALWKQDEKNVVAYFKSEAEKYVLSDCLGQVVETKVLERRFAQASRRGVVEDPVNFPFGDEVKSEPLPSSDTVSSSSNDPFALGETVKDGKIPPVRTEGESEGDFLADLLKDDK